MIQGGKDMNKKRKNNIGMTTVEVILLLVVLIGLVLIFKNQITGLVNTVFDKIAIDQGTILS